jgi:hypothetical protein
MNDSYVQIDDVFQRNVFEAAIRLQLEAGVLPCNGSHVADISFEVRFPRDENSSSNEWEFARQKSLGGIENGIKESGHMGFHESGRDINLSWIGSLAYFEY